MTIAYKLHPRDFTSRVTLDRPALSIRAEYLDGPFSYLENGWRFEPHGRGGCDGRISPSTTNSAVAHARRC